MFSYIVRRLMGALIVLIGITIITFLLVYAIPADPARLIVGPKASEAVVLAVRHNLGLDLPLPLQYWHYMVRLLHGDLGISYQFSRPVTSMVAERMGPTFLLAFGCWIAEIIIGIPLGIYTALRARKLADYVWSAIALVGISMPVYWLGLVFLYWFGFRIPIFPLGGYGGIYHLILPSLTYGLTGAAFYIRLLKSSMLEILNQDYVRTARAKGAGRQRVIWRHVLRNALIPVVTYGGIDISYLLTGVILIEVTFDWNGLGVMGYTAIGNMDIPVIMGTIMFTALVVVIFTLVVDILYGFIDPRIRFD